MIRESQNPASRAMPEKKRGMDLLRAWQKERLTLDRAEPIPSKSTLDVTVLAYHFWPKERSAEQFDYLECALRETWRQCGFLKTVLVCNERFPEVEEFAARIGAGVEVQVEPALVPGRIETMSADMNGKLFERFSTSHVLVVQDDGFPLRPGLESFVGKWDFLGAPLVRDLWWVNLATALTGAHVMNGGFSLRTRSLCERVAKCWREEYASQPYRTDFSEDLFWTKLLPMRHAAFRRSVRFPTAREALFFSYDAIAPFGGKTLPFGFHGAPAFHSLHHMLP